MSARCARSPRTDGMTADIYPFDAAFLSPRRHPHRQRGQRHQSGGLRLHLEAAGDDRVGVKRRAWGFTFRVMAPFRRRRRDDIAERLLEAARGWATDRGLNDLFYGSATETGVWLTYLPTDRRDRIRHRVRPYRLRRQDLDCRTWLSRGADRLVRPTSGPAGDCLALGFRRRSNKLRRRAQVRRPSRKLSWTRCSPIVNSIVTT